MQRDEYHGDEQEIIEEARRCAEEWEAENADNWKYQNKEVCEHE